MASRHQDKIAKFCSEQIKIGLDLATRVSESAADEAIEAVAKTADLTKMPTTKRQEVLGPYVPVLAGLAELLYESGDDEGAKKCLLARMVLLGFIADGPSELD